MGSDPRRSAEDLAPSIPCRWRPATLLLGAIAIAASSCSSVTQPSARRAGDGDASVAPAGTGQSQCSFTVAHPNWGVPAEGTEGSVDVKASAAGCEWSAASDSTWISITSDAAGSGDGRIAFRVAANNEKSTRAGAITIGHQTIRFAQDGAPAPTPGSLCTYALTSPKNLEFPVNGGSAVTTFRLVSGSHCEWIATTDGIVRLQDTRGTGDITIRWTVPEWGVPISCARFAKVFVRWNGPQEGENILITQFDIPPGCR